MFRDFLWSTKDSWSRGRRVIGKVEWTQDEANPRFIVTSLKPQAPRAQPLYEELYCARGEMENRIKECQGDLFADRTSPATMRASRLRLWLASMAYVLLCALRRIGLAHTQFASATCGTIRLKLLEPGALVTISARRVKVAFASACPFGQEWRLAVAASPAPWLAGRARVAATHPCRGTIRRLTGESKLSSRKAAHPAPCLTASPSTTLK